MRLRRPMRRAWWLAVTCMTAWLSLGAAGGPTDGIAQVSEDAPGATARPPATAQARRKLRVADADLARLVTGAGGRLVADYGSFRIVEVDEATATALAAAHAAAEILHDHDVIMLNVGP